MDRQFHQLLVTTFKIFKAIWLCNFSFWSQSAAERWRDAHTKKKNKSEQVEKIRNSIRGCSTAQFVLGRVFVTGCCWWMERLERPIDQRAAESERGRCYPPPPSIFFCRNELWMWYVAQCMQSPPLQHIYPEGFSLTSLHVHLALLLLLLLMFYAKTKVVKQVAASHRLVLSNGFFVGWLGGCEGGRVLPFVLVLWMIKEGEEEEEDGAGVIIQFCCCCCWGREGSLRELLVWMGVVGGGEMLLSLLSSRWCSLRKQSSTAGLMSSTSLATLSKEKGRTNERSNEPTTYTQQLGVGEHSNKRL